MSRRSSNAVKLARAVSHHPLDRNGVPVLDDPQHANRLPKRCAPTNHQPWRVGRRFVRVNVEGFSVFEIEFRCVHCGERSVETEIE